MTFKADKVKFKVHANDAAASNPTPATDGGELAIVGSDAASAVLKRFDGTNWVEVGGSSGTVTSITAGVGLNPASAITGAGTIDLNLSSLADGTDVIDRTADELIYLDNSEGTATAKGKRKLTSEIPLKSWKDCSELTDSLTGSEVNKVIQVKEVTGTPAVKSKLVITLADNANNTGYQTILFANAIGGTGTAKYFEITLKYDGSGSIGFDSGSSAGTQSDPYQADSRAANSGASISITNSLDDLEKIITDAASGAGHTKRGNISGFVGWTGSNWTVTKDASARTLTIEATAAAAGWDFSGVTVTNGSGTAPFPVTSVVATNYAAAVSTVYRYELKNPSIDHLSDVDTSSTAPTSHATLKWSTNSGGRWLPSNHSEFNSVSVTQYGSWNQTSRANGFPLGGTGDWNGNFTSATNYVSSNWVDLIAGERAILGHETFVNHNKCGSQKYLVKPAADYNSSKGYQAKIEIINLHAEDMNVERKDSNDPQFVIPQGTNGASFVLGSSQKAVLVANKNSSNVREWIVSIHAV